MERTVPHDIDAERATLGSILLDREAIIAVAPFLMPDHFYLEKHALVYEAMLACYGRREPPDLTTVASELRRQERLDLVSGLSFLGELLDGVPTAVHIEYYARIVERAAVGRALIETGGQIVALGFDDTRPVEERLDEAGQRLFTLSSSRQLGQDFVPLATVADEYFAALGATADEGDMLGVGSGYPDLDRITQGMKPGELIVLAARPGVGKTALALGIAHHVALRGQHVGIFSLEMDRELLLQRLLALELGLPTNQVPRLLRRGDPAAISALARVADLPIHIDHTPALHVLAIRDRARRLASDHPIELWIVDYLQLAQGTSERDDEVRRITAVSQGLTTLARTYRTPVLALSQLSRAVESRANHVPMLADLRGSGSIEQDASQVWFIYREELYDEVSERKGIAQVYVEKHRNGPTGVASLRFDAPTTRFLSLERARTPEGY